MSILQSLHFGVNKVDPSHYGTEAPLRGCENDARDMQAIARALGYETEVFLTKSATSNVLLDRLSRAAQQLVRGDTLLLTLACHGAQLADVTGDEDDDKDETWCLYDRMVIDDEVYDAFAKFKEGVTIFVVSDSCHSGTSTRMLVAAISGSDTLPATLNLPHAVRFRCISPYLDHAVFDKFKGHYAAIKRALPAFQRSTSRGPDVVLFSGCQDEQTSADGAGNGVFTENLKTVWNGGAYQGDCRAFRRAISDSMNSLTQVPNLFPYGPSVENVLRERPFSPGKVPASLPAKKHARKNGGCQIVESTGAKTNASMESSMLHPSVYQMVQSGADRGFIGPDLGSRAVEGGCFIRIDRSLLAGKSDKEIFEFFAGVVAPEICSNYFVARDAFSGKTPRGGSVSCSADTSGTVKCTGTWTF
jgi:hypothetical protein